jgi:hypothetical protein
VGDYLFGYAAPGKGLARDVGSGRPRPSRRRWLASSNCVALGAPAVRSPQPSTHKGTSPDRVRTVSQSASEVRRRTRRSGNKADPGALYDPELFRREILPKLAGVKLSEIVEAAGCSKAYASDIRRGKWTPHVLRRGGRWGSWSE